MMKHKTLINLILIILIFSSTSAALAQDETLACEGEAVSGTVVAVDEESGTVLIDTGEGQCSVSMEDDYDHPIISLMDAYFSSTSAADMAAAVEGTQGWAVYDEESGSWSWAAEGDEGADQVTVNSVTDNGDGTFTIEFTPEGSDTPVVIITEDSAMAADYSSNLDALNVDWTLLSGEEGSVMVDAGEQIAGYHEDGFGFGVLVKLYSIAKDSAETCSGDEACTSVDIGTLVEAFDSGTGMGLLFQEYGKPALLGVGHVRQEMDEDKEDKGNKPVKSYEVDGEVWVVYDEDSEGWALAGKKDEGALPAAILAVVDNEDGTQTLELAVEGVEGSVFLTVEARKTGKPENTGKPDKDNQGKNNKGFEAGSELWVVYDPDAGLWSVADEEDEGALAAVVLSVTDNEDGTQTLELEVEGVAGSVFLTVETKGHGKPENTGKPDKPGKPDKQDNPNKPDK